MQELAMASDAQLKSLAQYKSQSDFASSPNRKVESSLATAIPLMDSFLVGASAQGSLKKKVLTGGKQLKDWGIFLAVTGLYRKAIDKIVSKSETLQDFKQNSPFAYGIADTVLAVTAGISGVHYINKGYQKFIAPHIPEKVKSFARNIFNSTDESSIGKSINNGMKTFAKNYPKITKTLSTATKWALPLICLGVMGALAIDMIKAKVTEKNTYKQLEQARLAAAQQLASEKQEEN